MAQAALGIPWTKRHPSHGDRMAQAALGIPWTSSTPLDGSLMPPGQSAAGLKKARKALREQLAEPRTISLGRRGTVSLDSAAMVPCLQTATRWGANIALALSSTYREAGLGRLVGSESYRKALGITTEAVRKRAVDTGSPSLRGFRVPDVLVPLIEENPTVRDVAVAMNDIHAEVIHRRPEIHWFEGQRVRTEGDEALVVIDRGDREILRHYDAGYMSLQGIGDRDSFILQELQWTPETVVSSFLPAYDVGRADRIQLQQELAAEERPLSELPEELLIGSEP